MLADASYGVGDQADKFFVGERNVARFVWRRVTGRRDGPGPRGLSQPRKFFHLRGAEAVCTSELVGNQSDLREVLELRHALCLSLIHI